MPFNPDDDSPPIVGIIDGILRVAVERKADELRFEVREDDNLDVRVRNGEEWSKLSALDCTHVALARLLIVSGLSIIPDDRVDPQIGWARIHGVSMIFETQPLAHCRENIRIWFDWNSVRPWLELDGIEADDVSAIITRADELSDEGRYDDACLLCDQVLSREADCAAAFTVKGFCYRSTGFPSEAVLCFRLARKYLPVSASVRFLLGQALEETGDIVGATTEYDEALRLDEPCSEARVARVALRVRAGDLDGAIADLDELVRAAPRDAYAYLARAKCHLDAKNFARADADMRQAVWLDAKLMVDVDELKSRFPRA